MSTRAPGARVPRSTADQPPPDAHTTSQRGGVTLGPRDRLIGELHIDGDVRLGGTVQGEIHATGDVEVDDEAKVNASLAGGDVNIRGSVSGPVTARKRLVVARSGSLVGDVRVARLVIQDGASFSGNVSMGPQVFTPVAETSAVVAAPESNAGPSEPAREAAPRAQPTREAAPRAQPTREAALRAQPTREVAPRAQPTREVAPRAQPTRVAAPQPQPTRNDGKAKGKAKR